MRIPVFLLFYCLLLSGLQAQAPSGQDWAYDSIHIPKTIFSTVENINSPIVIAVVDDGFRLSHKSLADFIYHHPKELPNNQLDDDGNTYVDDVNGWDVSDRDPKVGVVEGREKTFFHGTYIASIITEVAKRYYGEEVSHRIKIMPIKVLSDNAQQTYVKDGYKGIQYAANNGADIICMAWSGGEATAEELQILKATAQKGILMIGSAGNLNQEKVDYPAQSSAVLAVSGVDKQGQKIVKANYGLEVAISAPAVDVMGAHPEKDNAFILEQGTSPAAAIVAGVAGVLLSSQPNLSRTELMEALLNTATPFSESNSYSGKMGAGRVNLKQALAYISGRVTKTAFHSPLRPQATLSIDRNTQKEEWEISPPGDYHGFRLTPNVAGFKKQARHHLDIMVGDSLWNSYDFTQMPTQLFVPAQKFKLKLRHKKPMKKGAVFQLHYQGESIDSTTLYCSGTRFLSRSAGQLEDGSGVANYANNCSCKWLITVPPGQRIRFIFDEMATEGNVDFVYLVDGKTALPERIFAKFSGHNLPPVVSSKSNEVLVWFVSDSRSVGKGWRFSWEVVK